MLCKQGQLHLPFVYLQRVLLETGTGREYYDLLHGCEHPRALGCRGWRSLSRGSRRQAGEGAQRAERLIDLRERVLQSVTSPRASHYLPGLIDHLFADPAVTAASVEAALGCNRQTAANLINRLVDRGVLRQAGERERDRVYLAPAILDLMATVNSPKPRRA